MSPLAPVRACACLSVCICVLPYESRPLLWSLGWSVLWWSSWGLYLSCCHASPSPSYTHTRTHSISPVMAHWTANEGSSVCAVLC